MFAVIVAHAGAAATVDPEEWLKEAEAAYDKISAYTAVFHKQQRVRGKLLPEETIVLKSENLRPVTSTGIGYLLASVAANIRKANLIHQDVESRILIRIKVYDQDDQLVEYYGYEKLDLTASLSAADFDPKNPQYHF